MVAFTKYLSKFYIGRNIIVQNHSLLTEVLGLFQTITAPKSCLSVEKL